MTTVSTNLGNTRESARQMRFEPTGPLQSTNVQKAIEEIVGENTLLPNVITATGSVPVTSLVVQTNQVGAITLTLPDSGAWVAENGYRPLSIFDISGNASTNNVTVNPSGVETISGLASLTIATDYGGFRLAPKSGGGWLVV